MPRRPKDHNNAACYEAITMWCLDPALRDRLGSVQLFPQRIARTDSLVHHRPALVEPSPSAQLGEEGVMQATPARAT